MDLRFKDGEELSCKVLVRGKTFLFVKDNKTGEYKIVNTDTRISMAPGPMRPVWWKSLSYLARRSLKIKTVRVTHIPIMPR